MSIEAGRLDGVTLLVPHLYTGVIRDRMYSVLEIWQQDRQLTGEALIPYAQALGALTIDDQEGDPDLYRQHLSDPNTYALFPSQRLVVEKDLEIRAGMHDAVILRPESKPIATCSDDELLDVPYVFYSANEQRGKGKYLIETKRQARRVLHAAARGLLELDRGVFERREYIPTPGSRYTSYRLLLGPNGDPLAAAFLYSAHTKGRKKTVRSPAPAGDMFDSYDHSAVHFFENRWNPYYLGARDIRSNTALGGGFVPLMGDRPRRITDEQKQILYEEGLDPGNPTVPDEIMAARHGIAAAVGKVAGMEIGVDYMRHARNGRFYYSEFNFGCMLTSYIACWMDPDTKPIDARIHMGRRMLSQVARQGAPV